MLLSLLLYFNSEDSTRIERAYAIKDIPSKRGFQNLNGSGAILI
jgi:hypothetical protein